MTTPTTPQQKDNGADAEREHAAFITEYRLWKAKDAPNAHPAMVQLMAESHWQRAAGAMWMARAARATAPVGTNVAAPDVGSRAERVYPPEFPAFNPNGLEGSMSNADLWDYACMVGWRCGNFVTGVRVLSDERIEAIIETATSQNCGTGSDADWAIAIGVRDAMLAAGAPAETVKAETLTADIINLLNTMRPEFGAVGSRDVDVAAQRRRIDSAIVSLGMILAHDGREHPTLRPAAPQIDATTAPAAPVVPAAPLVATPHENTQMAIEGAIAYGRQGTNPPPSPDHWLAQFWSIGQQLAKLGETSAWDNVTRADAAPPSPSVDQANRLVGGEVANAQLKQTRISNGATNGK